MQFLSRGTTLPNIAPAAAAPATEVPNCNIVSPLDFVPSEKCLQKSNESCLNDIQKKLLQQNRF